jgi:hypothetical protein
MAARTNLPAVEQPNEHSWYVDRSANNHVTAALENLQLQEPFKGEEKVVVCNGSGCQYPTQAHLSFITPNSLLNLIISFIILLQQPICSFYKSFMWITNAGLY